jgi:two-component system chemotaxis response regulator CheB
MTAKQFVVIGASAGGLEAIRTLVAGISDTFPAAICIVLHTSPESPGVMPEILSRAGRLRTSVAVDGQRLEGGRVYIAPPDRHLLVEPGRLRVTKGPREHRFRPAIDPLFRSAAQVFGPAVVGVVLTGNLDDGTAGLWTIKKLGGVTIVQDPSDASFPSMPLHALKHVDADYVVPVSRMASLLAELTSDLVSRPQPVAAPPHVDVEVKIAKEESPRDAGLEQIGRPSPYACPECHGVLLKIEEGGRIRFRCHIGHAYSVESLLAAMNEGFEKAIGTAQRALEEGSLLMHDVGRQLKHHHQNDAAMRMMDASERATRRAEAIRELMLERDAVPTADR